MMEFSFDNHKIKKEEFLTIEKSRNKFTDQYIQLCKAFYLDI